MYICTVGVAAQTGNSEARQPSPLELSAQQERVCPRRLSSTTCCTYFRDHTLCFVCIHVCTYINVYIYTHIIPGRSIQSATEAPPGSIIQAATAVLYWKLKQPWSCHQDLWEFRGRDKSLRPQELYAGSPAGLSRLAAYPGQTGEIETFTLWLNSSPAT